MAIEFKVEPASKRKISEINPNLDSRVSVLGRIIDMNETILVVDDSTGKINVSLSEDTIKPVLKPGRLIRVFGFVIPSEQVEIQAEIIQDMSGLKPEYVDLLRS